MFLTKLQPYRRISPNIEFILNIPGYDIRLPYTTLPYITITIPTSTNFTYFFSYLSTSSSIIKLANDYIFEYMPKIPHQKCTRSKQFYNSIQIKVILIYGSIYGDLKLTDIYPYIILLNGLNQTIPTHWIRLLPRQQHPSRTQHLPGGKFTHWRWDLLPPRLRLLRFGAGNIKTQAGPSITQREKPKSRQQRSPKGRHLRWDHHNSQHPTQNNRRFSTIIHRFPTSLKLLPQTTTPTIIDNTGRSSTITSHFHCINFNRPSSGSQDVEFLSLSQRSRDIRFDRIQQTKRWRIVSFASKNLALWVGYCPTQLQSYQTSYHQGNSSLHLKR